jgi:hypothetical protein
MDFLYGPCPLYCHSSKKPLYWYHADCGGRTMLRYEDIFIVCPSCNTNGIIFEWKIECQKHQWKPNSKQNCLHALAIMNFQQGNEDLIKSAVIKMI